MAKTKWNILFAAFVLSCLSLATLIVAFCTPYWVVSQASERTAYKNSEIQYGLFAGSLTRNVLATPVPYDLIVICVYEHNVCVYSCQKEEAMREAEVVALLAGNKPAECPISNAKSLITMADYEMKPSNSDRAATPKDEFINAGLWLSTVIFLGIAMIFAGASASFAIINVLFNPVEPFFSVFGLYIWNGIVIGSTVLTMILWGALYGSQLSANIAITDTLTPEAPYSSANLASLGASYWVLFISVLLHSVNVGLLLWRQYEINKEPPPTTIDVDKSDLTIIMF
ncbi:uncharacterized protein LOC135699216 [Ochlerotatus camptorhynchus]|uniref:uncharacterized protein LOC135699216 n=1 Tax=Ochlerotatus camptorhynchus TaxID=644619 RepID=UPI0031D1C00A